MTVCIATIYNNNAILGASDRMVTGGYGDITFEPPAPKILDLTNSIAVMTAGDQNIQVQVYLEAHKIIGEKINATPAEWINVSDATEVYSKCFFNLRNKLIENHILSQYNLTFDSFIAKQKNMSKAFIDLIASRIEGFQKNFMEDIETIITGVDDTGPHIYLINNGEVGCYDKLGFASIGIGSGHAVSHFMFSAYSRSASESEALLTIHQAKKKSEVSPGVGKETDMCVIGPQAGTFNMIAEPQFTKPIIKDLDKFYEDYKNKIEELDKKTEDEIKDYLAHLTTPPSPKQEISSFSPSTSPSSSPSPSVSPSPSYSQ